MKVENLIDDLRDGVKLLALLEVLSGERLPMERGRVLRRPHYLSNINTALEFLKGKRVRKISPFMNLHKIISIICRSNLSISMQVMWLTENQPLFWV